ncbi:acetylornithine/N-succinyldiaminopimelate aminotransferase [Andreprevotia lacus DSM 23236]|jgi:acetylornithine/N-succinyldiaminopimelate aminotransferase|uniref:Diaminobutyrate--2-oxoglutarate transaminase n=1 Tax=Andreprevotia lacus DSM 23236 TaxID=1121001 RepID=A0A1W1Y087_9NEIS|nr:acetylornithine transaminase [Andreprevotia lacus]SMC29158.1 acetylornithine/N-succinyldiaminopimelate aminotransferase [Andreprevotia lacus DSM 23236]
MHHLHPTPPKSQHVLMNTVVRPETVFVSGRGAYMYDEIGLAYLDWVQGWAVNCLGHSPDVVAAALARQATTLLNPSPAYLNRPAMNLAQQLVRASALDEVFFASSGAEANEGAIKLARKWGKLNRAGAHEIITFDNGYHGRTIATMSATGKPGWDVYYPPQVPGFPKAVFNDLASVAALIGPQTVAIMLEPVQGEGGVRPAEAGFVQGLRTLCDRHGLLLIFDEVQTGCARTGTLFAYQQYGVEPDIMTLGKGLGAGVPISALLAKRHACVFEPGDQGGTFCGNPLVCAVGEAVLQVLDTPEFLANVQARGKQLREGLREISARYALGEVRGKGLLLALEVGGDDAPAMVETARQHGFLLNAPRNHCLRFMPTLNSTADEIAQGLVLLDRVIGAHRFVKRLVADVM